MAGEKSVRLSILGNNRDVKAKLDEVERWTEEAKAKHPELSIGLDTAAAQEKLYLLRQEMRAASRDGDNLKKSFEKIDFGNLGRGVAWASALSAATGPLPVVFAGMAAGIVGVSGALASAGIGLGVFGAVAKSVAGEYKKNIDAFTAASDQLWKTGNFAQANKAFAAATKGLTPGIKEMVVALGNAKSMWHEFVSQSADGVAKTLAPAINLIPDLLEKLQAFLPGTEAALKKAFGSVGKSLDSGELGTFLSTMAKESGPALSKLAGILGHLADIGMKAIVALTPLGDHVLGKIDSFLAKADSGTNSGIQKFLGWLSANGPTTVGVLKNLGSALVNVAGAFAGTNGASLAVWSGLASVLAKIASNPIGADALAGLLVLTKLGPAVVTMVELGKAFKALAASEWLAEAGAVALDAVPIIAVLAAIGVAIYLVVTHWNTVKTTAEAAWNAVVGIVETAWRAIVSAGKAAWSWIQSTFASVGNVLTAPFRAALGAIEGEFNKLKSFISASFDAWWRTNGDAIKTIWHGVWNAVTAVARAAWAAITTVARAGMAAMNAVVRAGTNVVKAIFRALSGPVSAVWNAMWGILKTEARVAWTVISTVVKAGWIVIKTVFAIGVSAVKAVWNTLWGAVKAIVKTAWAAVQAIVKIGWDVLVGLFGVFINVITGKWRNAWTDAKNMVVQVWNAINGFIHAAMGNFAGAISNGVNQVIGFFRGMGSRIVSAVGNLGSLLWNAGKNVITGLINGIENAIPGLHSVLGWVTNLIPSWKGPASVDARLLYNSGHLIIGGLVDGLRDGTNGTLHRQLTNTTNVIAGTRIPALAGSGGNGALQIEWVGGSGADSEFISWLKKNIRIRGGNPGVLGR